MYRVKANLIVKSLTLHIYDVWKHDIYVIVLMDTRREENINQSKWTAIECLKNHVSTYWRSHFYSNDWRWQRMRFLSSKLFTFLEIVKSIRSNSLTFVMTMCYDNHNPLQYYMKVIFSFRTLRSLSIKIIFLPFHLYKALAIGGEMYARWLNLDICLEENIYLSNRRILLFIIYECEALWSVIFYL